ncbi:hypothetical protein [Tahibacter sp.]|uniref:hypothetical protein n=1 Tax=Tahibacter sp. TaxID=2056211 RepID=UPI0028C48239|nr:hypothetical protein [Tahibacter sp.]
MKEVAVDFGAKYLRSYLRAFLWLSRFAVRARVLGTRPAAELRRGNLVIEKTHQLRPKLDGGRFVSNLSGAMLRPPQAERPSFVDVPFDAKLWQ